MNKLIEYIMTRIAEGVASEDLYAELTIIQKLIKFIPSYQIDDALNTLMNKEISDAE